MKVLWRMLLLFAVILLPAGCPQDFILDGVVTFEFGPSDAGYCYAYLDDDTDITNGYVASSSTITYTLPVTSIHFSIDTSGVAAGSYYLIAGVDLGEDNLNPLDPLWWEYGGWYGSNSFTAPAAANVTNLSGGYSITIYGQF